MGKEFVPYEIALKLKEVGFKKNCLTKWGVTSLRLYADYKSCSNTDDIVLSGDFVSAPLWQQAFDWFRKEHHIDSSIEKVYDCYNITITTFNSEQGGNIDLSDGLSFKDFLKYEEARQVCLEKLIEIVQNEKHTTI